jgi:hypothetical protein
VLNHIKLKRMSRNEDTRLLCPFSLTSVASQHLLNLKQPVSTVATIRATVSNKLVRVDYD